MQKRLNTWPIIVVLILAVVCGAVFLQRNRTPQRPSMFVQHWGGVESLLFSSDNKRLFVADDDGHITLYSTENWQKLSQWRAKAAPMFASPDGRRLFTVEYSLGQRPSSTFSLWDATDGVLISSWQLVSGNNHREYFSAISSDFSRLALVRHTLGNNRASAPGRSIARHLRIVNATDGKEQASLPLKINQAFDCEWLNKDKWLHIRARGEPSLLLQTSNWEPVASLPPMERTTLTEDKGTLVGVRNAKRKKKSDKVKNGVVIVHDLSNHRTREVKTPYEHLRWAYLLPDALVIQGVREVQRGAEKPRLTDFIQIRSSDGKQVKSEFPSLMSKVGAKRELLSLEESTVGDEKYEIRRARDGRRIASLDADAPVLDENWQYVKGFGINHTAFSPNGEWFVSGGEDGLLRCWRLPSAAR